MALLIPDTVEFLRELELNNNREWFAANKKRYEQSVKRPMEALAAQMIERMKEIDPAISMQPKDALFRIYRDIRFSKDKSPYKDHIGMAIGRGDKMDHSGTWLYFHIAPRTMGVATGYYMLEPAKLMRMRQFLAANPGEFEKRLADPAFKKFFGTIAGEKNKVLPPELKEAAVKQPLIFNKQFYYWGEHDAEEVLRDDLDEYVMEHIRAAQPMNKFLGRALAG